MVVNLEANDISGLEEMLSKTEDALTAIRNQIASVEAHREQSQESLRTLDQEESAASEQIAAIEQSISEAETTLRQTRVNALVAKDTSLEESANAQVLSAEIDLSAQRSQLTSKKTEQSKASKRIEKEKEALRSKLAQDASELTLLEQQLEVLQETYEEIHQRLGAVTREYLRSERMDMVATIKELKNVVYEHEIDLIKLEAHTSESLARWPSLLKAFQKELDAEMPKEPVASAQVAKAAKRYIQTLVSLGQQVQTTRWFSNRANIVKLLAVNEQAVSSAMLPGFDAEARLNQLDDYAQAAQQEFDMLSRSTERYSNSY